jgi:hypothetical protein
MRLMTVIVAFCMMLIFGFSSLVSIKQTNYWKQREQQAQDDANNKLTQAVESMKATLNKEYNWPKFTKAQIEEMSPAALGLGVKCRETGEIYVSTGTNKNAWMVFPKR